MRDLETFKIKFFGGKHRKEQIKQVKMEIQAKDKSEVEGRLRWQYGYEVISGLKNQMT